MVVRVTGAVAVSTNWLGNTSDATVTQSPSSHCCPPCRIPYEGSRDPAILLFGRGRLAGWGATMCKETDVEATLENCRALISQIIAGLSAEEPFVDASSATELLLCLERAASALKKAAPRP